jgi:prepilin-type N-terminal cleavage/methylation domain-containing protein
LNKNNKIQAFTLSEIIVVLILISIVVALAFSVLSLVQKHMRSIEENLKEHTIINKLEVSLSLDFNRFSRINYNDFQQELQFYNEIDTLHYQFNKDYIIKELDTFKIQLQNKHFYFEGEVKQNGDIDAMKLTVSNNNNKFIFVYKQNDATSFID